MKSQRSWTEGLKEEIQRLINPRFDDLGAQVHDVIPDKCESCDLEPKEGGGMAYLYLTKLLMAEIAKMKICIQGQMMKPSCFELSELAKGQEDNPALVWSIA